MIERATPNVQSGNFKLLLLQQHIDWLVHFSHMENGFNRWYLPLTRGSTTCTTNSMSADSSQRLLVLILRCCFHYFSSFAFVFSFYLLIPHFTISDVHIIRLIIISRSNNFRSFVHEHNVFEVFLLSCVLKSVHSLSLLFHNVFARCLFIFHIVALRFPWSVFALLVALPWLSSHSYVYISRVVLRRV